MSNLTVSVKKQAIVSTKLYNDIIEWVESTIINGDVFWDDQDNVDELVRFIDSEMKIYYGPMITTCRVISDERNNTTKDINDGIHYLELWYKQKDCMAMSKIQFTIQTAQPLPSTHTDDDTEWWIQIT